MLCDRCGEHEATIHEVLIKSGHKLEQHLCEGCAADLGIETQPNVPINEMLSKYIMSQATQGEASDRPAALPPCPGCGMKFSEFKQSGLLGCPTCYETFEPQLGPMLARAHEGATHHVGKVPRHALEASKGQGRPGGLEDLLGSAQQRAEQLATLRKQLNEAIDGEQYERAAQVRDEIQRLSQIASASTPQTPGSTEEAD